MSVIAKVGERAYEFESFSDLTRAREIYANFTGDQNELEQELRATITTSTNHTKEQQNENLPRYLLQYGRRIPRLRGGASPHQFKGQSSGLHPLHLFLGVPNCGARVTVIILMTRRFKWVS